MASNTYGAIKLSTAEDVGAVLKKKTGSADGYKPKEWADTINLMGLLPIRTASGTIAHFEDGANDVPMKSVVANITPIQDLHGYSKPWAGGCGKNLFDIDGWLTSLSQDYTKNDNTYTIANPVAAKVFYQYFVFSQSDIEVTLSIDSMTDLVNNPRIEILNTSNQLVGYVGSIGNVPKTSVTATGCKIRLNWSTAGAISITKPMIETGSTSTSFEPYANVCPISGTDELTLKHKGKNLFDTNTEFSTLYVYAVAKNVLPSATCTMSFTDNDTTQDISGVYFGFVSSDYTGGAPTVYRWGVQNGAVVGNITNLSSENMTGLFYYPNNPTTLEKVLNRFNIQIELGNTATAFEPYNAETYTLDLGQTIYGGGADCISGTGSITWGIIDLSTINWSITTNRALTAVLRDIIKPPLNNSVPTEAIAEKYDSVAWSESLDNHKTSYAVASDGTLVFYYDGATPTGLFAYPLATPTEYTFTGQPINSYLGVNNLYTDSGEVLDVEYRADMNLLIAELGG